MVAPEIEKENFREQKKEKARMKQFGNVEIPQEAFIGVLKINKRIKLFLLLETIKNCHLFSKSNIFLIIKLHNSKLKSLIRLL